MSLARKSQFITWLETELAQRGWSDHQLARHAGISHSVISKARSGLPPKWEACEAIANALKLPPEQVFRQAGLLAPVEEQASFEEWRYILALLPERDRYELLQIARLKLEMQERREMGWSPHPARLAEEPHA